jgi:ribulose 1,5-bisphosphate synthetase/thiazole synthase
MWVEKSEDLVVEHTTEAYPGLIIIGIWTYILYTVCLVWVPPLARC